MEEWQPGDYRVARGKTRAENRARVQVPAIVARETGNALLPVSLSLSLSLLTERVRQHLLQATKYESEVQNEKVPTRVNEESTELARSRAFISIRSFDKYDGRSVVNVTAAAHARGISSYNCRRIPDDYFVSGITPR